MDYDEYHGPPVSGGPPPPPPPEGPRPLPPPALPVAGGPPPQVQKLQYNKRSCIFNDIHLKYLTITVATSNCGKMKTCNRSQFKLYSYFLVQKWVIWRLSMAF
uniref:Uncharacterized protein n=1 Tax=Amphimedon queenslandica TaxID=400682 RepID=A0A1X7UKW5_AMPQE